MNADACSCRSATEVKEPRLSTLRARMLNHNSIWSSHELWTGVEWKTTRWPGSLRNAARVRRRARTPRRPV